MISALLYAGHSWNIETGNKYAHIHCTCTLGCEAGRLKGIRKVTQNNTGMHESFPCIYKYWQQELDKLFVFNNLSIIACDHENLT